PSSRTRAPALHRLSLHDALPISGTSRSASTIIGGMTQRLTRRAAAEFSFFLAIPMMFGATLLKLKDHFDDGHTLTMTEINQLIIDRKSTRLNSSHVKISYAVFCL